MTEQTRLELERQAKEMLAQAERMCSRCGAEALEEGVWTGGSIRVTRECQIFRALRENWPHGSPAREGDFEFWKEAQRGDHPAFIELEAQHARIAWGAGARYRLCPACNDKFLALVGDFFIERRNP